MGSENVLYVVNDEGRTFMVRVVEQEETLVEFYDESGKEENEELGQFVSRYYEHTLMDHESRLVLDLGVDGWEVSKENMDDIKRWLEER